MEIFLFKKNSIENCEENYKQTCSKQKIANGLSVNECHKIDTSSRMRKTEHMRSRQNVPGRSKMVSVLSRVFLGVAETIVSSLLCCGVGIVQCLFNLLYYVIGVRNTKKPPFLTSVERAS